jgi:hypothetical protein
MPLPLPRLSPWMLGNSIAVCYVGHVTASLAGMISAAPDCRGKSWWC